MNIGENINIGLKRKNITQAELARKLKVSRQQVTKWISNQTMPTADKLIEIIKILDLKDDFFPNEIKTDTLSKNTENSNINIAFIIGFLEALEKTAKKNGTSKVPHNIIEKFISEEVSKVIDKKLSSKNELPS